MKRVLFPAILALSAAAFACMWDSDTLAMEARMHMNAVDAITGRFPRNPPLYYEMRLARVERELTDRPDALELYDDAAVACDRLNRGPEAIDWMARKRQALERLKKQGRPETEHWYRYFANLGTFEIHQWFREGASESEIGKAVQARDHIARAVAINPDAHFGRERVQLRTIEWVIGGRSKTLAEHFEGEEDGFERAAKEAEGLAGLVVLGNAWESPDVFLALMNRLSWNREGSMAELARRRALELLAQGKKSLAPKPTHELVRQGQNGQGYMMPMEDEVPTIEQNFIRLRQAADEYHAARTEFMLTRLRQGRHPDTDPAFWQGYVEPARPTIAERPWLLRGYNGIATIIGAVLLLVVGLLGFAVFAIIRSAVRARRLRRGVPPGTL